MNSPPLGHPLRDALTRPWMDEGGIIHCTRCAGVVGPRTDHSSGPRCRCHKLEPSCDRG